MAMYTHMYIYIYICVHVCSYTQRWQYATKGRYMYTVCPCLVQHWTKNKKIHFHDLQIAKFWNPTESTSDNIF